MDQGPAEILRTLKPGTSIDGPDTLATSPLASQNPTLDPPPPGYKSVRAGPDYRGLCANSRSLGSKHSSELSAVASRRAYAPLSPCFGLIGEFTADPGNQPHYSRS